MGALKKMSRLTSEANQLIPTFIGDISGLYSTGASATSEDITPGWAYGVTLVEAMHMFKRQMSWLRTKEEEHSIVFTSDSRTLGGFPVKSYPSFYMHAIHDPLIYSLHWARTLLHNQITSESVSALIAPTPKHIVDYESLVKDPSNLPLVTPIQSKYYFKDTIKNYLPNMIKTRAVKNLCALSAEDAKNDLIRELIHTIPFNPRLAQPSSFYNMGVHHYQPIPLHFV